MHPTNFNILLDSLLGFILIVAGLVVLGYVLFNLLWWLFLIAVGIGFIVMGVRLRASY
jgi:hypothetical protein